jgi:hypothetical protein
VGVDEILAEFGQKTGLGNLKLNEDGLCRLVFDSSLIVDVERTASGFVLHSVVGQIPSTEKTQFFEMLLQANGPDHVVGQTAIGIDTNLNEALLYQNFTDMNVSYEFFEKSLDTFLGQIGKWKARLSGDWENFEDETKDEGGPTPPSGPSEPKKPVDDFDPNNLPPGMIKA